MQSHFILVLLFSILCVLSQPGEAFFREGRTLDVENKAFPKRTHSMMANVKRRNDVEEGYRVKLIRGNGERDSLFVLKYYIDAEKPFPGTLNKLYA